MIHIVQESCMDPVGAYVVFASVDTRKMYRILNGENSSTIPLFPSGFMISRDGQFDHFDTPGSHHTQKGTLLTFSYQVLVSDQTSGAQIMHIITSVFAHTIHKIKVALNCTDDD